MKTSPQVAALHKLDQLYLKAERSGLAKDEAEYGRALIAYCRRYNVPMVTIRFPAKRVAS